jgi:polyisoprenoid-binding protein YceI
MNTYRSSRSIQLLKTFAVMASLVTAGAQAATWKVDPAQSKLAFSGTQSGAPFDGEFTRYDARIIFDQDHLDTSSIGVTVETGSATSANPQRDNAMPSSDWFDVAEFPHAQFDTRSIHRTNSGGYEADGTLTIRGVTRPVTVPMTIDIAGDTVHLRGQLQINRTDFGIGQGTWSNPDWVGLQVNVSFDFTAKRA